MPGITGYVTTTDSNPELLSAMVQPMLHREGYMIRKHHESHYSAAVIDLKEDLQNDSAESSDQRYRLSFYGRFYEFWAKNSRNLAARLLSMYEEKGWSGLADLNGEYLITVWDRTERSLTMINDRLGLKRLNLWQEAGCLAFASETKSLCAISEVSREIDVFALSELLTFGHLQEDRTLLKDVKLLPPASILEWKQGVVNIRTYWKHTFSQNVRFMDDDRATDEYANILTDAIQRRTGHDGKTGLLLSGGLDSRTVAGFFRRLFPKEPLQTVTMGHGHDHDTRFARLIAKSIRSRHKEIRIPEDFLTKHAEDYAWITDGMVTAHGCHRLCSAGYLKANVSNTLIGFLGDTIAGGKPLDNIRHLSSLKEMIPTGFRMFPEIFTDEMMQKTLLPDVYEKIKDFPYSVYEDTAKAASAEYTGDKIVIAELAHRQRLWNPICQMQLMETDGYVTTPFADKNVIDFCLQLPLSQRVGKKNYLNVIKHYLPDLARIPRSGSALPMVCSRLRSGLHWRWVMFRRKVLPKLTFGLYKPHNHMTFVHCREWYRKCNRTFIEKYLTGNQILEQHFNVIELERMIRDYFEKEDAADITEAISALLSYVIFVEKMAGIPSLSIRVGKSSSLYSRLATRSSLKC